MEILKALKRRARGVEGRRCEETGEEWRLEKREKIERREDR